MRGGCLRRAISAGLALVIVAAGLTACGGTESTTTAVPDKQADAEILNRILTRQIAAVEAYDHSLPRLAGRNLALARVFRAQEQEHIDSIVKALRGLGGKAEPENEEIEGHDLKSEVDYLRFLYEVESATIDAELSAISKLTASWPRSLLASIAADQAQHLTLLRRMMGANPIDTIPGAFENGTAAAP
jgi:ferritin-like protein